VNCACVGEIITIMYVDILHVDVGKMFRDRLGNASEDVEWVEQSQCSVQ
jgi:hypothetical protein